MENMGYQINQLLGGEMQMMKKAGIVRGT